MLLQFFAQRVAVNAEHLGCMRLIAVSAYHHRFEHGTLHGQHDHVIDITRLMLTQVAKIFIKALANDFLDMVFAHVVRITE